MIGPIIDIYPNFMWTSISIIFIAINLGRDKDLLRLALERQIVLLP